MTGAVSGRVFTVIYFTAIDPWSILTENRLLMAGPAPGEL